MGDPSGPHADNRCAARVPPDGGRGGTRGRRARERLAREAGLPPDTARRCCGHSPTTATPRLDDGSLCWGTSARRHAAQGRTGPARPPSPRCGTICRPPSYLTFYEEGEIRIAEIVDGPQTPKVDLWVGFEDAGHATALGKCVLRELDAEARGDYLARHALADLTPRTITHREELLRQLESSRSAPMIMDREEYDLGTVCIAVPVYSGTRIGSLGISFRADRMYRTSQVRESLLASAERVTRGLSFGV